MEAEEEGQVARSDSVAWSDDWDEADSRGLGPRRRPGDEGEDRRVRWATTPGSGSDVSGEALRLMALRQREVLAGVQEDLRQASAYVREVHQQQQLQAAQLEASREEMKRHLRGVKMTQAIHGAAEALGAIAAEEDRVDRVLQEHLSDASKRMRQMAEELAVMTSKAAAAMGAALAERERYERARTQADKDRARIAGNLCMERAEAAVSRGLAGVQDRMEAEKMHLKRYEADRKSGLVSIHRVAHAVRDKLKAIRA